MSPYEVKMWSSGSSTEAPEELETPIPSHSDPFLKFTEIPYADASKEDFEKLDKQIGEMLRDSKELTALLTRGLAVGRFFPK